MQRKTPELESLLINLQPWRSATHLFFFEYCEIFKNTYSEELLRTGAFEAP